MSILSIRHSILILTSLLSLPSFFSFSQSSYNFRTYFLRRSRDLFRSNLLPESQAKLSSPYSKASSTTVPASPTSLLSPSASTSSSSGSSSTLSGETAPPKQANQQSNLSEEERLIAFYNTAKSDLQVLKRAALTNRMYEGEKLVVEKPQLIVGGGGSGAEASVGGAGQPVSGGRQ